MKMNPLVTELRLYDIAGTPGVAADVSHINTKAQVKGYSQADDGEDDDAAWNTLVSSSLRQRGVDVGAPDGHDDPRRESLPPTLAARAFDVMVATHAAYESSKLDSLRRPALAPPIVTSKKTTGFESTRARSCHDILGDDARRRPRRARAVPVAPRDATRR